MTHSYQTKDTCSSKITFELDGDVVHNIAFIGGCNGNLQALTRVLDGMTVDEIEEKCGGILCGRRPTSCTDQLCKAVRKAQQKETAV